MYFSFVLVAGSIVRRAYGSESREIMWFSVRVAFVEEWDDLAYCVVALSRLGIFLNNFAILRYVQETYSRSGCIFVGQRFLKDRKTSQTYVSRSGCY